MCAVNAFNWKNSLTPTPKHFRSVWRHFCCQNWEVVVGFWHWGVKTRGAAQHPSMHRTASHDKKWPGLKCQEYQGWETLCKRWFTKIFSFFSNNFLRCSSDLGHFASLKLTLVFHWGCQLFYSCMSHHSAKKRWFLSWSLISFSRAIILTAIPS